MKTQAFIRIKVYSFGFDDVVTYYAVRMELREGGIAFWAGGHGYFYKSEDVISIEPYC